MAHLNVTASLGDIVDVGLGETRTGAQLLELIRARRSVLASFGLSRGDKVILRGGNRYGFFVDLFALWELGVCVVPIDPGATVPELQTLAEHSEAKLIIALDKASLEAFDPVAAGGCVLVSGDLDGRTADPQPESYENSASWEDPALLLYTSGSTGQPKGVLHTFRSLMARVYLLRGVVPLGRLERTLNLLPTHFGHGLICNCLYPLLNGRTLVLLPAFNLDSISRLGQIIDEHEVTFLSSVPTVWKMALALSDPPTKGSLQMIHCGSAPLSAPLREKIQGWSGVKNVKNTYGITETGSWLAGTPDDQEDFVDGFIGPGWGTDLAIVPSSEDGPPQVPAAPGVEGMVWARTPALMKGYYKRPDLTDLAVRNTWFSTGDIGYLDDAGNLVLVGRKRHEINKAGMKVYPEDIDLALERSDQVAEACCFAVEDPIAGQNIAVAIVPKQPDAFDLAALKTWLQERLSLHKRPAKWFVVEAIPKTSRGKVNRETVAKACTGGQGSGG